MGRRGSEAMQVDARVDPARGHRLGWIAVIAVIAAFAALVGYVLVGFPSNGFPGRAGPGELRRVEDTINRAFDECGLDERATIDWFWGQVDVPSTNGIVADMPSSIDLSRDELAHATGSSNYFWVVCPSSELPAPRGAAVLRRLVEGPRGSIPGAPDRVETLSRG